MRLGSLQRKVEEELLSSYESLYRFAFTYVHNPEDAMDIVQETAYKAIARADTVREETSIRPWLYQITAHAALDLLRKQGREQTVETVPDCGQEDAYADLDLQKALEQLEPRDRQIVVLRFFEDLKLQDIAQITGENINTVKTALYRSMKKLKLVLSDEEVDR